MVKAIPDGYHSITPYLTVQGVEKVIDFVKAAFGAEETVRMAGPGGGVGHAEVRIGDSMVMMGAPQDGSSQPATVLFYTEGVDEVYKRALAAGGKSEHEPADQFYGDRTAGVIDPAGNTWWIHTTVEVVSPEEMEKRQAAMASS